MGFFSNILRKKQEQNAVLGDGYTFRDQMFNTVCVRQIGKTLSIAVTAEPKNGQPGVRTELTLDKDGAMFLNEFLKCYINNGSIGQILSILVGENK